MPKPDEAASSSGLEAVMADVLLGPVPSADQLSSLCRQHGVSARDAEALIATRERLLVYRELLRGNLREALGLSIPRSMARLGSTFDEYFDRFLCERGPSSHYLRDVTPELLAFVRPLWQADARVPSYLPDLALHESLHIEVSALPAPPRRDLPAPLGLELGVELSRALRLVRYRHAVHELPEDEADRSVPEARDVQLLVYRSPEHDVRYLELTPLAFDIVECLQRGDTLGSAVSEAAARHRSPLTEALVSNVAKLLADLAERGVVLGPTTSATRPSA